MTRPILIGLGGFKRSGKDTVADYLVRQHYFVKLGMSDPLHEAMLKLNPLLGADPLEAGAAISYVDATERYGYVDLKDRFPEARRLLQVFGTEIIRDMIGVDFWVTKASERIANLLADGKDVVLTGVRFPNEAKLIRLFGGTAAWVDRASLGLSTDAHPSENSVWPDDFDITISNHSSLASLYQRVDLAVAGARAKHSRDRDAAMDALIARTAA